MVFDQAAPAGADADHLVSAIERPPGDGPDNGVQPGTVAATGEDPNAHGLDTIDAREGGTVASRRRAAACASRRT
jgi:hypothetical protein